MKTIKLDKDNAFSILTYQKYRNGLKRHQASQELEHLQEGGYVSLIRGHYVRFAVHHNKIKQAKLPDPVFYPSFICFRLLEADDKGIALQRSIQQLAQNQPNNRSFTSKAELFQQLPGSTFAYWVSEKVLNTFKKLSRFESSDRTAKQGLSTADDFRFIRTTWEVPSSERSMYWFPFAKGGEFSPFYL